MPRMTTALRLSRLIPPVQQVPPKVWWKSTNLTTCKLWYRDGNVSFEWAESDNHEVKLQLAFGFVHGQENKFLVQVRDGQRNVCSETTIPDPEYDVEIRITVPWTVDIRLFSKSSGDMVSQFVFGFKTSPRDEKRMQNTWNEMKDRIAAMNMQQLRYVNMPRGLTASEALPSSVVRQDFRHAIGLALQVVKAQSEGWYLQNLGISMVYDKHTSSPEFRALIDCVTRKSVPPTENNTCDPTTGCGKCQLGDAPIQAGQIKKKRAGKDWVGCENGLECHSKSFWFHLTMECAELTAATLPKKDVWWCKKCRADRPQANVNGLELRSRVRSTVDRQ